VSGAVRGVIPLGERRTVARFGNLPSVKDLHLANAPSYKNIYKYQISLMCSNGLAIATHSLEEGKVPIFSLIKRGRKGGGEMSFEQYR